MKEIYFSIKQYSARSFDKNDGEVFDDGGMLIAKVQLHEPSRSSLKLQSRGKPECIHNADILTKELITHRSKCETNKW